MKVHDITIPLSAKLPVYPGDEGFHLRLLQRVQRGDPLNLSAIHMGAHAGTHIDAPSHFLPDGQTVETIPLSILVGPVIVAETDADAIDADVLDGLDLPESAERVLFKTRNGRLWEDTSFRRDYVAIAPTGARWLVERGIRLVGVDYLSAEAFGMPQPETHLTLLSAGVVLVEGLDLRAVAPGSYTLVCLPLKVVGAEGAPARAVLLEDGR